MNKLISFEPQAITPVKFDVESLIAQAIDKNISVDTMERLLAMRKELKQEWAKEQYDRAMAAFQAACPTIQKTKEAKNSAGYVIYRYAPIESIVEQVKEHIKTNGFSYTTGMELIENGSTKVKVSVKVTHQAGHSEGTSMTIPLGIKTNIMSDSQQVAAAQTFAKRYAFLNAFGILTGDEDTDAKQQDVQPSQPLLCNNKATEKQIQLISILLGKKGRTNQELHIKYNVQSKKDLTKEQASMIIDNLNKLPDVKTVDEQWVDIKDETIDFDEDEQERK